MKKVLLEIILPGMVLLLMVVLVILGAFSNEKQLKEVVVKSMSTGEWETVEIDGHLLFLTTATNFCTIASMIDVSKYAVSKNWSTGLARFDEVDGLTVMTNRVWYKGKRYTIGED